MELNSNFWESLYKSEDTGWDIGYPSPPIKSWIDNEKAGVTNWNALKILIPGCGRAWEAEYLWKSGFRHVNILDWASSPLELFSGRVQDFPADQLHQDDFFTHEGKYDRIIEQTFFCAIDPGLRADYIKKAHDLLHPGGILAGVLFNDPLNADHPPYGGSKEEYEVLFGAHFHIRHLDLASNSVEPRKGRELFIVAEKES